MTTIDLQALVEFDGSAFERQFAAWSQGISHELGFWDTWFATQGRAFACQADFQDRVSRHRTFPEWLERLGNVTQISRVLDVGAGPLSVLSPNLNGGSSLRLIACDPLAHHYAAIARRYGVTPPIPTTLAFAEDLSAYFEVDSFDLTYCRNALDHSFSPLRGLIEMLLVTRPGGKVILNHYQNEAEHEKYTGFHQWNLTLEGGKFHIWNKDSDIDVAKVLSGIATTSGYMEGAEVIAVLVKERSVSPESLLAWKNGRIREFMTLSPVVHASLPKRRTFAKRVISKLGREFRRFVKV